MQQVKSSHKGGPPGQAGERLAPDKQPLASMQHMQCLVVVRLWRSHQALYAMGRMGTLCSSLPAVPKAELRTIFQDRASMLCSR